MKKYFSLKGFLRGLVPCIAAITVWSAWAIGYFQGSENIDQSIHMSQSV